MAKRQRPKFRAHHHQPAPRMRAYVMPEKTADEARAHQRTIRSSHNPYHEGLMEARHSGEQSSKRVCLGLAKNGAPHQDQVCTDHRMQEQERQQRKMDNYWTMIWNKLEQGRSS